MPKRSVDTSGSYHARTNQATRTGSVTLRGKAHQLSASSSLKRPGRRGAVRRPFGAYFERAQRDDPQRKKIALVATAHYLVRVMWAMLKRGTFWEENTAASRVIQLARTARLYVKD